MKNPKFSVHWRRILVLAASLSLVLEAGCGDDTVRGAGSINVPRPARFVMPEKSAARRGQADNTSSRPR